MIFDSVIYDTIVLGGIDDNGIIWCVSDIIGWWDTPPINQDTINPTSQDGSVVTASTLAARALVLRGTGKGELGTDPALVFAAYDQLTGISWPLMASKALTVVEQGTTRTTNVVLAGSVRKQWAGEQAFIFEIPLLSEDPRKYSVDVSSQALPGTVVVLGNYPSDPVLTLAGGGDYTITNTTQGAGAALILTGVPAGTVVDMRARTVMSGTIDQYAAVDPASVWWELLPGNNVITKSGGAATISHRDAWL